MLINRNSDEPVYAQIINQYKRQIAAKAIKPHEKLPSVRQLSYEIGINPNTLQKAFTQLELMGLCYTVSGKGRFVSENAAHIIAADVEPHLKALDKIIEELVMRNLDIDEIILKVRKSYKEAVDKTNS